MRLVSLLILLTACGASQSESPQRITQGPRHASPEPPIAAQEGRRSPNAIETGVIRRLVEITEETRELDFRQPVRVHIETATRISASLSDQITDEDVVKAQDVYGALGLLPPDMDVRALLEEVLGEQVVGYYDTDDKRLVIRDDVMRLLVSGQQSPAALMARLTLLHELVHALQDQWLDLGQTYESEMDSDAETAFRCVAEGDAMLAMMIRAGTLSGRGGPDVAHQTAGQGVNLNALDGTGQGSESLADAPPILRVTLVAPYLLGMRMAAASFESGGWAGVNRLFEAPPPTMEQVLHLEKLGVEGAEAIALPAFPSMDDAGFEVVDEDTLGELELAVYLANADAPPPQRRDTNTPAAAGWGGDRLRVYSRGQERAVVWWLTFDNEAEANEGYEAAARVGGQVRRQGRALLVLRQVPPELRGSLVASFDAFAGSLGPSFGPVATP